MKERMRSEAADAKLLLRNIPSVITALVTISVAVMNILANKTICQNEWSASRGRITLLYKWS